MKKKSSFQHQVDKAHYFREHYFSLNIFLDYYHQINLTLKTNPQKILEIGIGNGSTSLFLKNFGLDVTTCDFDESLNPDIVADIRNLPLKDESFDTIIAFEVLEHLPFADFTKILAELNRTTKKNVILSIPYSCISFDFVFRFLAPKIFRILPLSFRIPYSFFTSKNTPNKEHYWAMGRKGYSKKKVLSLIQKYFKIKKHFSGVLNSQHYYFILEKK